MPWKPPRHNPLPDRPRPGRVDRRVSACKRGLDRKHRKMREQELREQPLCEECLKEGFVAMADTIDHVTPLAEGGAPHDPNNRRPMCGRHNFSRGAKLRRRGAAGGGGPQPLGPGAA